MKRVLSKSKLLAGHAIIGLAFVILLLLAWQADPGVADENRLLENLQAAALFLALVLSLVNLAPLRRQPPPYVAAGLAVLFLSLLLRELDVEKLGLPGVLTFLWSGTGRNLLLGLLWGAVLLGVAMNRHRLKEDTLAYIRSPLLYYLLAAATFYFVGEALDKKLLPLAKPVSAFWEETAECLAAFWCVLGTAVWTAANSFRRPFDTKSKTR
jgi:hypothetical protein